ncbi:mCG1046276, partial [Mus musculus]
RLLLNVDFKTFSISYNTHFKWATRSHEGEKYGTCSLGLHRYSRPPVPVSLTSSVLLTKDS